MSDNFRVVECLHSPSTIFAIYDYTKIAYLVGNYICIREVVGEERPTFIMLDQHSQDHVFGLTAYANCLVLAEKTHSKDVILHFYQQSELHIRVNSELGRRSDAEQLVQMEMHSSANFIYLLIRRDNDLEIITVEFATKIVTARAFLSGDMHQFKLKSVEQSQSFSVSFKDSQQVAEFELVRAKQEDQHMKALETGRWSLKSKEALHCWVKEELIVFGGSCLQVMIEGRCVQTIEGVSNVKNLESTLSGFIAVCSSGIKFYKKNSSVFELKSQFCLEHQPNSPVHLSPQQDLLVFYNQKQQCLFYSNQLSSEESLSNKPLPLESICHTKQEVKTYNSTQSLFVVTSGNLINIYSPYTYQCYISMSTALRQASKINDSTKKLKRSHTLLSNKMLKQSSDGEPVETVGVHPATLVIGVAFRNVVRVYNILYSELKLIREVQVSHCKDIGFNNSGSIMYIKVSGKQGSKIYLYNTLNNYELIETLSASKPLESVKFGNYDSLIYGFHQNGYYIWSVDSHFKHRHQSQPFPFTALGSEMSQQHILVWGQRQILEIGLNGGNSELYKLDKVIANLYIQNGWIVYSTTNGQLFRCKTVSQMNQTMSVQGFKIPEGSRIYAIRNKTIICCTNQGNIICLEWGPEEKNYLQLVTIERKKIIKYQKEYCRYEQIINDLDDKMAFQIQLLKEEFVVREQRQREMYLAELQDREDRYLLMRSDKIKIEQMMEENMSAHEQQTLQQIRELEKIYERKIALTTNKLLTAQQLGFRNQLLAKDNLHFLEKKHSEDIQKVRFVYSDALSKQLKEGDFKQQLFLIKKQYETKLSELEQENENLIKQFQQLTENNIINLKKNVVTLELKYSEAISQKFNLQKEFDDELMQVEGLRNKNQYLETRLNEELRRGEQLARQHSRIEALIVEKDTSIVCLERRIEELEKSNEIFKYRIIEMKNSNDPKEEEILKLKDNMIELEEQYEKVAKRAYEHEQTIGLLRKDIAQTKASLNTCLQKQRKLDKNYSTVIDKIRDATKSPIQEIRKMLMKILDNFEHPIESKTQQQHKRTNSPLGQLNRVREHLEVCLIEAVETGKKNQKQKDVQLSKKNRENSELLRQINDLRIKVRELEAKLKQRELEIQEIEREGKSFSSQKPGRGHQRVSTNFDSQTRPQNRIKTRESFFEKSLFKNHWKQKRLKTEQGSRKKSSHSLAKQQTNQLYIQSKQEVQQLRRMLQQKQTIIKQLINKIHKLS